MDQSQHPPLLLYHRHPGEAKVHRLSMVGVLRVQPVTEELESRVVNPTCWALVGAVRLVLREEGPRIGCWDEKLC